MTMIATLFSGKGFIMSNRELILSIVALALFVLPRLLRAAEVASDWQRLVAAAKKEGKIVIGAPPGSDFRNEVQAMLKKRFDLDSEFAQAPGPNLMSKIVAEKKAGTTTVDAFLIGPCTGNSLLKTDLFEPLAPAMVLPEVKDAAKWFGGHIWADNQTGQNMLYSFVAQITPSIYYNTQMVRPQEVRSYNDLLDSKWKGKIGLRDPRVPGGGLAMWAFLLDLKGEEYIRRLAQQEMFVGRNARQIADALAKGSLALTIGVGYRDFDPFLDANLPVKHLPTLKEGTYVSGGNGIVGMIKDAPHPNAAKVFLNWLLSREGQDLHGRTSQQPTRRLDVETRGLDGQAAKDVMTVEEFRRFQNFTEDKCNNSWLPGAKLAEAVLK
ncbi:MAG TPA: extracellular solute-binding protein [Candidatus Binatia bacterium]